VDLRACYYFSLASTSLMELGSLDRAKEVIGTFDEDCFQYGLSCGVTPVGFHRAPLLGTYLEIYEPVVPLIMLQSSGFDQEKLPGEIAKLVPEKAENVSVFFQFHSQIPQNPCQHFTCDSYAEVSVVFHSFFFGEIAPWNTEINLFKTINCGLFQVSQSRGKKKEVEE
jgi:hypothetical protein